MNARRRSAPQQLPLVLFLIALALAAAAPRPMHAATAAVAAPAAPPKADDLLPLPAFKPCVNTTHPLLPARWESAALLQSFVANTYWVAKMTFDDSAGAFRFALATPYGTNLDFLTTRDGRLYLLSGGDQPTFCTLLTARSPYTVPPRDWLSANAVCVGQAPILGRDQQWWKSPSGVGANWYWYDAGKRLPFRSMYYAAPTTPVPFYETFTFDYFPDLKAVGATNLPRLLAMCQKAAAAAPAAPAAAASAAEYARPSLSHFLKGSTYPQAAPAQFAQIEKWIPAISPCSSPSSLPPRWPDKVQGTAFLTAVSAQPNPFPSRVFYDWTKKAQNTTLYYFPQAPDTSAQKALLLGNTGYIAIVRENGSIASCAQALPGPQIPNWKEIDGCECRGQIAPGSILNPSRVPTKILWCPTDLAEQQVFWTWYSDAGTPVVFMQTNSSPTAGTGLNLADYYGWAPGSVAPEGTFTLPQACKGQPLQPVPQACHNCHLPLNTKKGP